ncbi:MAG: transcription antitermination factor NusB, partial [Acidimicrobiia bacterium]
RLTCHAVPVTDPLLARALAADVVGRVLRSGAYSNVLTDQIGKNLDASDRARLKALTFGVLRHLEIIDARVEAAADRNDLDDEVKDRLRISAFELAYGDTPDPITVSAGVDLVRRANPKAAGFANAVLRRIAREPKPADTGLTLPEWLTASLARHWSHNEVDGFAHSSAREPERIARVRENPEPGFAGIRGALELEPGPLPPGAVIQDAASIAVGNTLDAGPGMSVIDLAAAPGGKTLHLLDQVGPEGLVVATDKHRRRVVTAARRAHGAHWVIADATKPPFPPRTFDRVLLDAPCSGLGTLRRRPEIRLRIGHDDVVALADLQKRLLPRAIELVAPGGRLVYSVCTITPEETVEIVDPFDMKPADGPGTIWGKGRLLAPHLTGTDGMFISVFEA